MRYLLCQIVLLFVGRVMGIIQDYGTLNMLLLDSGLECSNKPGFDIYTKTVNFHGTFVRIPQVIIFLNQYFIRNSTSEFVFSIPEINYGNFTISVQCLQENPVYTLILQWVAVDDDRITVINQFYTTNLINQTYTFSHTNSYATKGFITLTNFGFSGNFSFEIKITTITSNQVRVQLSLGQYSPLSLGFQVVLGTPFAFDYGALLPYMELGEVNKTVLKPAGYKLFLVFQRMVWSQTLRNQTLQIIWSDTDSYTSYTIKTAPMARYGAFTYKEIWLNLQNPQVNVPMLCQKWRVSKRQDFTFKNTQLYMKEKDNYFTIGYTEHTILLDETQTTINFVASIRCSSVQKVSGSVFSCFDNCQQNSQIILSNCHGGMNLIEFHFKFVQQDQVYQKLMISVSSTLVSVRQSVVGTSGSVTILSLQLVKQ